MSSLKVEATRDSYCSSFLSSCRESLCFKSLNTCPLNKEPQTHKLSIHALTLKPTSRNPKLTPKKFDGSFPMAEEVNNEAQEKSEMLFPISEPMRKMPHKIPLHKCEKRELKIKSDLKPYFSRMNTFRTWGHMLSDTGRMMHVRRP